MSTSHHHCVLNSTILFLFLKFTEIPIFFLSKLITKYGFIVVISAKQNKITAQYVLDTKQNKITAQYVFDTKQNKITAQYVFDTNIRKQTKTTQMRHEHSYKQLEDT
jgi:hypothetical protein